MKCTQKYRVLGIIITAFIFFNVFLMSDSGYVDENNLIYSDATNGRIGIGTDSPVGLLHLKDSGVDTYLNIDSDIDRSPLILFSDAGTIKWNIGYNDTYNQFTISENGVGTAFKIVPGSVTNTLVLRDGKVGIGTSIPAANLDVRNGGSFIPNPDFTAYIGTYANTGTGNGTGSGLLVQAGWDNKDIPVIAQFSALTTGYIEVPRMTIKSNGKVGIGTTNPDEKLTVNGNIHAEKVIVSGVSADFVFEDDYNLRPLNEVESFISENGHLPEIPSAKEVETHGIELAEMNAKLLQKIEELTLYMIEQNKCMVEQEKRIAELEKKLSGNE